LNTKHLPWFEPLGRHVLSSAIVSGVAVFVVLLAVGGLLPAFAGALVSLGVGLAVGGLGVRRERMVRERIVADLTDYRLFTHLMRAQSDRIVDLTTEAARSIHAAVADLDAGHADGANARPEAAPPDLAIAIAGALQFQDVTQQQLAFLCRLSFTLDDHTNELAAALTHHRRLDHLPRFKDLFNGSVDHAVMTSQRQDHHAASGHDVVETQGPAVEMFLDEEEGADAHSRR
jgi:hypothetical protein